MAVRTLSTTEAKNQFSAVVNSVADHDETVVVQQHGRPKVAIISTGRLDEYEALADRERRQNALEQLRQLRKEVGARNQDLTEEQAMELATRFVREVVEEMYDEGKLRYADE